MSQSKVRLRSSDAVSQTDNTKTVPLDILLSLLRPGELEKLERYVASYVGAVMRPRQKEPSTQD